MKKHFPNVLTLLNLFCGAIACILLISPIDNVTTTMGIMALLMASLILDFFDGFIARAVGASGPLGAELDSLADVISFGFSPALMLFNLLDGKTIINQIINKNFSFSFNCLYPLVGLMIVLFSAYRLAKFNIDTEQTYYFKGLNTPTCTMLIFSIYYMVNFLGYNFLSSPIFLLSLTVFCCTMLVSNIPLKALKFKGFKWKDNYLTFIIIGVSLLGIIFLGVPSIPFSIAFYILISIIFKKKVINPNH